MGLKFTSVLNSVHYILTVLREWREHPHYLQLSWYHDQYAAMIADTSVVTTGAPLLLGGGGLDVTAGTTNTATDVSLVSALETSKSYTFSAFYVFSRRYRLNNNKICKKILSSARFSIGIKFYKRILSFYGPKLHL